MELNNTIHTNWLRICEFLQMHCILSRCIITWFGKSSSQDRKLWMQLHPKIQPPPTSTPSTLHTGFWKAANIIKEPWHLGRSLLSPLLLGKRYRSLNACTTSFKSSFFPTVEQTSHTLRVNFWSSNLPFNSPCTLISALSLWL